MANNFAVPLYITGEYTKLLWLVPELITLGYKEPFKDWQNEEALTTDFGNLTNTKGRLGWSNSVHERTIVSATNTDLVLALATLRKDGPFQSGEWVIRNREDAPGDSRLPDGTWCKVIEEADAVGAIKVKVESPAADFEGNYTQYYFRRPTKEEILEHFNPNKQVASLASKPTSNIIGFKLIKEYPGSPKLGHGDYWVPYVGRLTEFVAKTPYTDSEGLNITGSNVTRPKEYFTNHPEFWEPVYEEVIVKQESTIREKNGKEFIVTVFKGGNIATPYGAFHVKHILAHLNLFGREKPFGKTSARLDSSVLEAYVQFGCNLKVGAEAVVKIHDLLNLVNLHRKLNGLDPQHWREMLGGNGPNYIETPGDTD